MILLNFLGDYTQQGRDNRFETGCAFHSKISKTWCAKSAVSLLGAQKVGAQMRTLAHYTLPPLY